MIFIKKMCVLRQMRPGFSGDGKQVGGVVKAEQYGKSLSVEVSVVGFAPLAAGEYYAIIADSYDRVELLPLRGKSLFNLISELDVSEGFCAVICLVKNGITPLAYGVSGNRQYDFEKLIRSVPAAFDKGDFRIAVTQAFPEGERLRETTDETQRTLRGKTEDGKKQEEKDRPSQANEGYNDETIAENDYYREAQSKARSEQKNRYAAEEKDDERGQIVERNEDAGAANPHETKEKNAGKPAADDEDAENVRHPFNGKSEAYYRTVKDEIDELFNKYESDDTLSGAFPFSKWVKVKEADKAEYLIGIIYEEAAPLYICYAFPAENKDEPPEDVAETCAFVPLSPFENADGCFVIFQSAATGECVKLKEA
ncbi:MAG: hypothetical protein SPH68_00045 [Candidatus Borkfalkiaceae bacterium]|nr:hypothetical protein [Clostridia bacterium]MDY6222538.1 hypothetical protein [Christensenellaceae bacterium]